MFGIKEDGSIDLITAADQFTDLLALFGGSQFKLSVKEKQTMHEIITGFESVLNPETNSTFATQLETVAAQVSHKIETVQSKIESSPEGILNPEVLMAIVDQNGVDMNLVADVATEFINKLQAQVDFAVTKIKEFEVAHKLN